MFHIAICDDEPGFISFLSDGIRQLMSERGNERYRIDEYTDPHALLQCVQKGVAYHILFQDIMLGDSNGIETAKLLRSLHDVKSSIIFVSSQPQFAVETFVVGPDNFLTKPFTLDELRDPFTKSLNKWEMETTFQVTDVHGAIHYICLGDIIYLEVYKDQTIYHENAGKQIVCASSDKQLEMLHYPRFFRCHRNYIVNMGSVRKLAPSGLLEMNDGTKLPISRRRYKETQAAFGMHLEVMP